MLKLSGEVKVTWVQVKDVVEVKHFTLMVKVRVRNWAMQYVYDNKSSQRCKYKDVCLCVRLCTCVAADSKTMAYVCL